jgi:hypothetical protein
MMEVAMEFWGDVYMAIGAATYLVGMACLLLARRELRRAERVLAEARMLLAEWRGRFATHMVTYTAENDDASD